MILNAFVAGCGFSSAFFSALAGHYGVAATSLLLAVANLAWALSKKGRP